VLFKTLESPIVTGVTDPGTLTDASPLIVQGFTSTLTERSGLFGSGPRSVNWILQKDVVTVPVPVSTTPLEQSWNS
jgi:hypothetical protein